MTSLNTFEWILVCFICAWSLLWSMWSMVCSYQLWYLKQEYFIKCRWSTIEISAIIIICILYTITRSISFVSWITIQGKDFVELSLTRSIIEGVNVSVIVLSSTGFLLLMSQRAFYDYFNAKLAVKSGLVEWRSMIDDSLVTNEMSWFIRNKHTLGNKSFLNRIFIILFILACSMALALRIIFGLLGFPVAGALIIVSSSLVTGYSAMRYPSFQDEVGLKREKHMFLQSFLTIVIVCLVIFFVPVIVGWDWDKNETEMIWHGFLFHLVLTMLFPTQLTICSVMVISWFREPLYSINIGTLTIPVAFDTTVNDLESELVPKLSVSPSIKNYRQESNSSLKSGLKDVLADNYLFHAFMVHLFAEFSSESALCLIECTKFRDKVLELNAGSESDAGRIDVTFCKDINQTHSSLVEKMESKSDIRSVAWMIAERYLNNEAPYEVNVSYRLNNEVFGLLNDESNPINHSIFDNIISECFLLLKFSFSRFNVCD